MKQINYLTPSWKSKGLISAALSSPVFVPQMSAASFSQTAAGNQA